MIIDTASRLQEVQEYFFSRKLKEIARLRSEGKPIINLGIGSPDLPPAPEVIEELKNQSSGADQHGYQPYQGILPLREAIRKFSAERLQVDLDDNEVLPLMGSKEGITHISLAFLDPGDQVLIPSLGYPTYTSVTKMVGAKPVYYPLLEERNWEPDWDFLEKLDYSRVKILWLNYPHMPTGAKGSGALLERFVAFAKKKKVLLCHDNPYSFILNDRPVSILSIAGAKEVAIELNSLSKTFNMAGWRIGWLSGDSAYLTHIIRIKSNMDSGMFRPLQLAAVKALGSGSGWFEQLDKTYSGRRELVFRILDELGCGYTKDQAGMFVWAKAKGGDGNAFTERLLHDKNVFITPGAIFGEAGKAYIRISLCAPEEQLKEVLERIKQ